MTATGPRGSLCVGLISGTSMDAVDAALVECAGARPRLLATLARAYPAGIRERIAAIVAGESADLASLWTLDVEIGEIFAATASELIAAEGLAAEAITAIGSHGQTVAHDPDGASPYTVQIGDPNVIAERTGITTVADFRRRDVAAGGQGAPLAPMLHATMFAEPGTVRVVVNIGGIANVTLLAGGADDPLLGYDTGPGNALMDLWIARHLRRDHDAAGAWAAEGTVDEALLAALAADPYFAAPVPKSTGRDYFDLRWLDRHLDMQARRPAPADVQRTLCELTAITIADAAREHGAAELLVCGGGAHNAFLCERIAVLAAPCKVASTARHGLDPDWVEATAFAWLASRTLAGLAGNAPSVTGARHPVVLGAIYPATR